MKHASQTQHFRIALAHSVKASLLALALAAGAAGCKATQTPTQVDSPDAQTPPLTPQEWVQRNFQKPADKPVGQAPTLMAELRPVPQTTNSSLPAEPAKPIPGPADLADQTASSPPQTSAPTPAANPAPQPSPSTPGPDSAPKLVAQASQPVSPAANPPAAQAESANPQVSQPVSPGIQTNKPAQLLLREGDSLRISFPGAPSLNTMQQIRRDGNITLPLIGEFKAAGLAPSQAEKELLRLYDPHLQVKEVTVTMESSAFAVYVTGAVQRPGKIMSDRPISALEAVVEAGVDHTKANLKKVRVVRQVNGRTEYYILNLKDALLGNKPTESFDLRPSDIIFVPERFSLF